MTIGITFPVRGHDKIKSVPWSVIEHHRQEIVAKHGVSPERLHSLGGLTLEEIAKVTGIARSTLENAHGPQDG